MRTHYYKQALETIKISSSLVYRISRPLSEEGVEKDVTAYSFGWERHPGFNDYIAVIPESLSVLVNNKLFTDESSADELINSLSLFYRDAEERERIMKLLLTSKKVKVIDLIPQSWQESSIEELENEGWFIAPD